MSSRSILSLTGWKTTAGAPNLAWGLPSSASLPITVAFWTQVSVNPGSIETAMQMGQSLASRNDSVNVGGWNSGEGSVPEVGLRDAAGTATNFSITNTTTGGRERAKIKRVYHRAIGLVSSTERYAWINGRFKTANTTSRAVSTPFLILAHGGIGADAVGDYVVAWPAVWKVLLNDYEIAALARGVRPDRIRPAELIFWVPEFRPVGTAAGHGLRERFGATISQTGTLSRNYLESFPIPRRIHRSRRRVPAGGGAQTVEVGLNSETDSAFAVAKLKRLLVGLNAETDSVLAASARKSAAVGLTSETDSVLAATRGKLRTVGLNEEADTALSLQAGQTVAVGLATETDSAFSVSWLKAKLAGLAEETGSALAVAKYKVKAVGLAAGAETALAATRVRAYVVGLASTAASSFSVGRLKARIVGLVTEVDSVLQVTPPGPGPSGPSYVLKYPLVSNLVRALTQRVRGRTHKVFWDSN